MRKKRFEILLPLRHNDGRPVSEEAFEQTREELVAQFGGITVSPHTFLGIWVYETRYEDELLRLTVDADDTPEVQQFFLSFKSVLLERFYDIVDYVEAGWNPTRIAVHLNLSTEQVLAAIRYIDEHRVEVMAEYARMLQRDAQGNRPEIEARRTAAHARMMARRNEMALSGDANHS